jgi:hypothetical protein
MGWNSVVKQFKEISEGENKRDIAGFRNNVSGLLKLIPLIRHRIDEQEFTPFSSLTTLKFRWGDNPKVVCVWYEFSEEYRIYLEESFYTEVEGEKVWDAHVEQEVRVSLEEAPSVILNYLNQLKTSE